MVSSADVGERIKAIIRRDLKLGADIPLEDSTPFFGTEADIDSLLSRTLETMVNRIRGSSPRNDGEVLRVGPLELDLLDRTAKRGGRD